MDWNSTGRSSGARTLLAVVVGGLALCALDPPAWAGDDSGCWSVGVGDIPANGAVDVVRNPMIVIEDQSATWDMQWGYVETEVTLRDASDNAITAYMVLLVDGTCVPVYRPEALLEAETRYCIDWEGTCFTTGTVVDQEDPAFELGPDDGGRGLRVEWTGSPDIVMITMRVGSSLGSQGMAFLPAHPIDESTWAEDDGDTLQLTAWDSAGNSTTQSVRLRLPTGCQTAAGLKSPLIFSLLLMFLWGRRRG